MNNHEFFTYINSLATKSMLYELAATPKPGLVDRSNSGAHNDMDIFTFIDSSLSINTYFCECAKVGYEYNEDDYSNLLNSLRPIGIVAEKKMFEATKGVNTHKGLIFSLGLISAVSGVIYKKTNSIYINSCKVSRLMREVAKGLTNELSNIENKSKLTYGEILYKKYGIQGIRGEAESGFETVLEHSLPLFISLINENKYHINDILVQVLLSLMVNTEDSNILGRHDIDTLIYVKEKAKHAIGLGGYLTYEGQNYVREMDKDFIKRGISPGGAADLLAITIMLHMLQYGNDLRGVR
ncbi:triphosphoribosyl-dephospho-CoA synthase CitG [Paratissierella segnis]|jgi:triphosphoribosyl-dephospho-CoA synthase|uniref:Probable 2-(5''-triphosphoribosyl)-3'-dephosphocoenzyme-A synthase n=1 Tax=Paratissierella segnis TaxID=2763679 RepID=A0A926EVZ4_9FIRM|nr:triphosphoribosyl-dephospho-CoA synthase CitG [Paratissierella segnis]MBC8587245.1 triphosphoribosyl-dephospho-CoA synthase CitG [Paratissierella segnis]